MMVLATPLLTFRMPFARVGPRVWGSKTHIFRSQLTISNCAQLRRLMAAIGHPSRPRRSQRFASFELRLRVSTGTSRAESGMPGYRRLRLHLLCLSNGRCRPRARPGRPISIDELCGRLARYSGIGRLVLAYKVKEPKITHPIGDNLDISPPIFIQVGFANTGRTSLQRNFFSTRDDIFYVGEPYGECGGIFTMIKNIEDFTRSRAPASLPGSARANHCRRMASSSLQAFNRLFYSRPYLVASGYRRGAALCE